MNSVERHQNKPAKTENLSFISRHLELTSVKSGLLSLPVIMAAFVCTAYLVLFVKSISPYWFHPHWTTDDGLQQLFPFHAVYHPEIFRGDLIYEVMKGYLAPVHYWLGYLITLFTHSPVMTGHYIMLIQLVLAGLFTFLAVKRVAGSAAGFFALTWLFHTRYLMQRMTGGLPRGWATVVLSAFLYFILSRNHRAVLITILIGCMLHPPATLTVAVSYGLFLLLEIVNRESRSEAARRLKIYLLLSPFFAFITLAVIHRPDYVGQMVTYKEALKMPEFHRPDGRFPFVPLRNPVHEISSFGFHAFIGRLYNPGTFWKRAARPLVLALLVLLAFIGWRKKREVIPKEVWIYALSIMIVYFMSRLLAFKLYVPDRHIQFPLALFFIVAFSAGLWRAFYSSKGSEDYTDSSFKYSRWSLTALAAMAVFIYICSGSGLYGSANFNYSRDKKGEVFTWIKNHTAERALIAGHPTFIDPVQLFGMRRGYATTETAHPFYKGYYREIKRRLIISLKAHYARNLRELLAILKPEGVDYFVFERARFYPGALKKARYFPPLNQLVRELTSRPYMEYAYRELPDKVDLKKAPFMPFKDRKAALVDLKALEKYLAARKNPDATN
ncbi:MAG: hypothetical protein D6719_04685 [Candidatus Dadabacteria bacterium]|nr:MAG: hypothetical protein D6719_04685 [Candidatus Dadabacteria bacterium]